MYVSGIWGNQAFPQLPGHFQKPLEIFRNENLILFNLQHSKSGKRHNIKNI